jgi:hypothetical protein
VESQDIKIAASGAILRIGLNRYFSSFQAFAAKKSYLSRKAINSGKYLPA